MGACVICEAKTSGSLEFCRQHYGENYDDIKRRAPWVRVLKNDAQRERRRRSREYEDTSLNQLMERYEQR